MSAGSVFTKRGLSILCLVVLVALAGCSGLGGDGTATATPESNGTEALDAFGENLSADVTPASELSVSKSDVTADALAAIESTATYRLSGELDVNTSQNNVQQSQTVHVESTIDREREAFAVQQTVDVGARTVTTDVYLVDGTLYQRNQAFARQYGSEWVRVDVSGNQSERFRTQDEIGLHGRLIENGTVTFVGAQAVDGEDAYRLRVESNESAISEFLITGRGSDVSLNFTAAVWVSAEDGRLLRSEGIVETNVTSRGTTIEQRIEYTETFTYGDASVTLPEEAETAVEIGESGQTRG